MNATRLEEDRAVDRQDQMQFDGEDGLGNISHTDNEGRTRTGG